MLPRWPLNDLTLLLVIDRHYNVCSRRLCSSLCPQLSGLPSAILQENRRHIWCVLASALPDSKSSERDLIVPVNKSEWKNPLSFGKEKCYQQGAPLRMNISTSLFTFTCDMLIKGKCGKLVDTLTRATSLKRDIFQNALKGTCSNQQALPWKMRRTNAAQGSLTFPGWWRLAPAKSAQVTALRAAAAASFIDASVDAKSAGYIE